MVLVQGKKVSSWEKEINNCNSFSDIRQWAAHILHKGSRKKAFSIGPATKRGGGTKKKDFFFKSCFYYTKKIVPMTTKLEGVGG